jgi:Domain of Unknown Function (DUF1080)
MRFRDIRATPSAARVLRAALIAAPALLLLAGAAPDGTRNTLPPPSPNRAVHPDALFSDNFRAGKLDGWTPDREGVWSVMHGVLRGDLPDGKQQRSFIFAGSESWTNYAVDLDVCGIRGVDKGVAVRVVGENQGVGVDLRGPGYQDVVMYRGQWRMGKAAALNGNGVWHHLRVEARGGRYRVWVDGSLAIDKTDSHDNSPAGRIALPAYTGGIGECTVYYDNVVVTPLK